ncbi:MAG: phosphate/phosphite/phosphonate ABC transporter substrate-binding protein [Anaerolineaceae bacterium]|nr:phosphate/phosphite/phosphonate ABC transporter substrate-binding protein [Anaerolineaceae bacterium]
MQNYVGQQIDHYRIIERLGMGGMAVVYKAFDTRLERDVALKLIRVDEIPPSQHDRLMKRFEREAKAMAKFSHPNIVPVHDYGEVDGSPYLVMEYIPGGTLKERIAKPIPWEQAVRWLTPVADALRYAHAQKVIHRDVKPSNILFDSEGRPLLTDFGIAKVLETDEATLTGTGLGVGTPEYMAPEQWRGIASEATDQYALGVVFYELLTGNKPYTADTPAAVAILQATEPLIQPSKLVGGIPEELEKVLYKALARDPQDRYEDMGLFQEALAKLLSYFLQNNEKAELQDNLLHEEDSVSVGSEIDDITFDEVDLTPSGNENDKGKAQTSVEEDNREITTGIRKKKNRRLITVVSIVSALIIVIICSVIYFMPASWWCGLTGNAIEGCEVDENPERPINQVYEEITDEGNLSAEENLGTEENPIIWAVVPYGETNLIRSSFSGVADYLFNKTGLFVEPFFVTEYADVIEGLSTDPPQIHMSSLATFAYLFASEQGVADAALIADRYGSVSYNGQIFVRADSGITSIADLTGKTFCRPDPLSTSGWIIPSITLRAAGIDPDTDLTEIVDTGSHDAAVAGVYNGDCDAGSSYVDARLSMTEDYPDILEVVTVIEVTVDVPNDGIQFSPVVPDEIRDQIVAALLVINQDEEALEDLDEVFEWTKLVKKDDSFYDPLRQLLDTAGVDAESLFGN